MKRGLWFLLCMLVVVGMSAQIMPKGEKNSAGQQGPERLGFNYPDSTTFEYPFVTDYIILVESPENLPKKVMEKIRQGWKLYGTPFYKTGDGRIYQALVKLQ